MQAILALWGALTSHQRRRLGLALLLMLAGAGAELLAIGAIVPFLALLTNRNDLAGFSAESFALFGAEPVIVAALLFSMAAVLSAVLRLTLTLYSQRFALDVGQDLAARIFGRMLRQSYADHVRRQSSEVLSGIEKVQTVIFGILMPVMQGVIAAFMALGIFTLLYVISPIVATLAALFFAGAYALVSLATRRRLARNSLCVASAGKARIKLVQEGLGGIRDIILDRSQRHFEEKFQGLDARYRKAQAATLFIAAAPRFAVEAVVVAALSLIAVVFSFRTGGVVQAIPLLGVLALAAQRLSPLVQQAFVGWSYASGNLQPLLDVIALADAPLAAEETGAVGAALRFERKIALEALSFRYEADSFALHDISFTIAKGARLGLTGSSGSGKSTLLDLLMGLLQPTSGVIRIDDRLLDSDSRMAWRTRIAHVPQDIYLLDDTIMANIAFGKPKEDVSLDKVRAAAAAACIDEFIERLPQGYKTEVGERGIRLSGGQRQRLGIARALYRNLPVLILDEATNALDEGTELRLMQSITANSDLTLIVAAHRLSTLALCDEVIRLENGRLAPTLAGRASITAVPRG